MNIQTQVCGLIILTIIIIFSSRQKSLNLQTDKVFKWILAVDVSTILLDIISVIFIYNKDSIHPFFVEMFAKVYLVSLISIAYLCFLYVEIDIRQKFEDYKKVWIISMIITGIIGILILSVPIEIVYQNNQVYTQGVACYITYATAVVEIGLTVFLSFKYLTKKNKSKRNSILIWLGFWSGAAIIQFFFKEILIVSFASTLGILVIYLKLERNEFKYDYITKLFTKEALGIFIEDNKFKGKSYQVLYVSYSNINHDTFKIIEKEYYETFAKTTNALSFLIDDESIVLLFDNKINKDIMINNIIEKISQGFGTNDLKIHITPKMFYLNSLDVMEKEGYQRVINYLNGLKYDSNQYLYFNMDDTAITELIRTKKIEANIVDAIQYNKVIAYYQPIYSIKTKKFTGAEALIRLKDDDNNIIYPDEFIPIAEKNGMVTSLDYTMFEQVCKFISKHDMKALGLNFIDVNVSTIQAVDDQMAKRYIDIMKKYQVDPKYIRLEITESAVITNRTALISNMNELVEYGVHFALDDYGVGNSNISYLTTLPIKCVKIDKSFTELFFIDDKANYIVKNEIEMFNGLDLIVVFEGVEEKYQLEGLLKLDIDYIQGFYYSKPISEEEFLSFIKETQK